MWDFLLLTTLCLIKYPYSSMLGSPTRDLGMKMKQERA